MLSFLSSSHATGTSGFKWDAPTVMMVFIIVACAAVPLDLPQLVFASFGAISYALLQLTVPTAPGGKKHASAPQKRATGNGKAFTADVSSNDGRRQASKPLYVAPRPHMQSDSRSVVQKKGRDVPVSSGLYRDVRRESARPAVAPAFTSVSFDAQVNELLGQLAPSPESERVVRQLASTVQQSVQQLIPEASVCGVATGNVVAGVAFGVAVPEVDIVATISPEALALRMQLYLTKEPASAYTAASKEQERKVQKAAIRACTDRLVAGGVCKFRRSAFRGHDPKVTLLMPSSLGICDASVPVDFSVNATIPLYNAVLLNEVGRIDSRARALALVVRRWAKDRGICHAAKGHLSPYAWSLLVVYFLQVRGSHREGPLLPPLRDFVCTAGRLSMASLARAADPVLLDAPCEDDGHRATVGELFVGFVSFYSFEADWRRETASVLLGRRTVPPLQTEVRMTKTKDGKSLVTPVVWDPFESNHNVASETTLEGVHRLQEEFTRAFSMCTCGASLTDILEPWRPAEAPAQGS